MRKPTIRLELKYGNRLDEILQKITFQDDYNNLLYHAVSFTEDLYPYLKAAHLKDSNILFHSMYAISVATERSFSPTETKFLTDTISKSSFGNDLAISFRNKMKAAVMPETKSHAMRFFKKTLFPFANYLPHEAFLSLVGLISCYLLCDGKIGQIEREIIFKLFEENGYHT